MSVIACLQQLRHWRIIARDETGAVACDCPPHAPSIRGHRHGAHFHARLLHQALWCSQGRRIADGVEPTWLQDSGGNLRWVRNLLFVRPFPTMSAIA